MFFDEKTLQLFNKEWALVTAGDKSRFNTMTIGWGGLGTLWSRPVATVYVKPLRYTHQFLDSNPYFCVSFFDERYKKALGLLGSKSGRDCDKVAESGLTPLFLDNGVTFAEAYATLLCKKIYRQDMDLSAIPQFAVDRYYQGEAPHTMYVGEVVQIVRNSTTKDV